MCQYILKRNKIMALEEEAEQIGMINDWFVGI
jgi:hypothetical protein